MGDLAKKSSNNSQLNELDRTLSANIDIETNNESDRISKELKRAMSNSCSIARIGNLTRKLSSKLDHLNDGSLAIDPQDFDLTKTLQLISQRFNEHGFAPRHVGVTFEGLTSTGVDAGATYWPSMSEIGYRIANIPKTLFKKKAVPQRKVISNVYGLIKPGEMLLVLGRPGAGCTSLLRTIAGEIKEFNHTKGEILYDGASMKDMKENFKNEVIYNPERKCPLLFFFFFWLFFAFLS